MTLVVPASYGGVSADCWDPNAREPVPDLGTVAHLIQRGRLVLRLHAQVLGGDLEPPRPPAVLDDDVEVKQGAIEWVAENRDQLIERAAIQLDDSDDNPVVSQFIAALNEPLRAEIVVSIPASDGNADQRLFLLRPKKTTRPARRAADSSPSTSSFLSARVTLAEHLDDVRRWAQALGTACGVPDHIAADLALAGELHDLGKADPRFQRMLAEEEIGGEQELLAKSVLDADDYATRIRRARLAGYDQRTRHELTSVALIEHEKSLAEQAHDWDLVLHLVASHHGFGRPFFEPEAASGREHVAVSHGDRLLSCSSDHGLASFASGVPQRFWRCVRRYGWFNLAWLESILRLADHRASEQAAERRM